VYTGIINSPEDRDNVFITYLEKGEFLTVEITASERAEGLDVNLDNPRESIVSAADLENGQYDSVAGWASIIVDEYEAPARATFFAETPGQVCLLIDESEPENADIPYNWTVEVTKNGFESTATDTATPTDTDTDTATPTDTETPVRDTDGDGVIDSEDYAPRDPAVQSRDDLPTTTADSVIGFGAGIAVLALTVTGVLIRGWDR
jgi:hypothetical protein